ncbi:hypothetical protein DYBT9275_02787 [Dyadobacter sp. CECT 9275]|uniref:Uncharacterized protein n=1 Tax=Dyadobacter helix TaxID=2822344 RepID=A0A916JCR0_9BACT|nr:hypothetical protein DYBT9275_02787 [Dyadobacter sp. CECT 9275]
MNAVVASIPTLMIEHRKVDVFRHRATFTNPNGDAINIDSLDPAMLIYKGQTLLVTIEDEDWTKSLNQTSAEKAASFFAAMDCFTKYRYRFYDRAQNQTIYEGPFKII